MAESKQVLQGMAIQICFSEVHKYVPMYLALNNVYCISTVLGMHRDPSGSPGGGDGGQTETKVMAAGQEILFFP